MDWGIVIGDDAMALSFLEKRSYSCVPPTRPDSQGSIWLSRPQNRLFTRRAAATQIAVLWGLSVAFGLPAMPRVVVRELAHSRADRSVEAKWGDSGQAAAGAGGRARTVTERQREGVRERMP